MNGTSGIIIQKMTGLLMDIKNFIPLKIYLIIGNYIISATFSFTNSRNLSSSSVKGSAVLESISIWPIFSPFLNIGTTISHQVPSKLVRTLQAVREQKESA